ncbi:hypothetical protein LZ30DRAFT_692475 [Colletotrichum cereale]|nr:hypothetical protein LZ30DRAFT_692475 [Colletotrichum cereale]
MLVAVWRAGACLPSSSRFPTAIKIVVVSRMRETRAWLSTAGSLSHAVVPNQLETVSFAPAAMQSLLSAGIRTSQPQTDLWSQNLSAMLFAFGPTSIHPPSQAARNDTDSLSGTLRYELGRGETLLALTEDDRYTTPAAEHVHRTVPCGHRYNQEEASDSDRIRGKK